jgi:hypothetical protein
MQLGRATVAKPDQDVGSIDPVKGANLSRNLQRFFGGELLDCLHIKYAIIKIAFGPGFAVKTFALTKCLLLHRDYSLRAAPTREYIAIGETNVG